GGRTEECREFLLLFAEEKGVPFGLPVDVGGAQAGGPFQLKIATEDGFYLQRKFRFYFKSYNRARLIDRDKKSFSDGKSIAGVHDGRGFRADDYCAREGFGGQGAVFGVE